MTRRSHEEAVAQLNARVDRLPVWGLSPVVFMVLGLCYFFAFYDITAIGSTLPVIVKDLNIPESASSVPITSNLLGYVIGAYLFGTLADYIGRRASLAAAVGVLVVGALLTAFSWNLASLTAFRFLTGIGIGAQIALSATLVGEFSSATRRGRYLAFNVFWGGVGLIIPDFIAVPLGAVPNGWRVVFGLGALIVVVLPFLTDRFVPESPRWLILHGKTERAEIVVDRMENRASRITGQAIPPAPAVPPEIHLRAFPTVDLVRHYLGRLVLVLAFWFFFYMMIYAYLAFEPTLLVKMGLSLPSGQLVSGVSLLGYIVGGVSAVLWIERFDRRYTVAGGLAVMVIGFIVIATGRGVLPVIVGGWLVSVANYAMLSPAYAYTAEVFPTRARASGMSIGDGIGHLGGAVQPFIIIALLAVGARYGFWFMAASAAVALSLMLVAGVRSTRGAPLTSLAHQ
jgi:putative MFS transporter